MGVAHHARRPLAPLQQDPAGEWGMMYSSISSGHGQHTMRVDRLHVCSSSSSKSINSSVR
jgi:hypothetical protein